MRLLCTVRDCRQLLEVHERTFVCTNGHRFDIARSGYVNLLQPQDRRSRNPGDTREAAAARRRFLDHGFGDAIAETIVEALPLAAGQTLVDAGCGEGFYTDAFRRRWGAEVCGVDLSVPAIELAARRYRDCQWVVANADRGLPFPGASLDAVTSITARLHASEFRRVLGKGGALLVVIPGGRDLVELREAILGEKVEADRTERTTAMFASLFTLERHLPIELQVRLDREAISDVMVSAYRALRTRERERLETLESMNVTLARDLLLFRAT